MHCEPMRPPTLLDRLADLVRDAVASGDLDSLPR